MPKLIKSFRGVVDGEIYPREFEQGDECPPELIAGAQALGALGDEDDGGPVGMTAAQLRAALDEKDIQYKSNASKAELAALLAQADSGSNGGTTE